MQIAVIYWQFVRYLSKELAKKNRTALPRIGLVYTNTVEPNTLTSLLQLSVSFLKFYRAIFYQHQLQFQGAVGGHIYSYVFVLGAQINNTTFCKTDYCSICDL